MSFRTFILKLIAFVVLFVIADQIAGYGFRFLDKNAGDKFERENFMRKDLKADVLVMGSSKAAHHYKPSVLEDSLNMKVYNCGQRGNGVIYEYGRLATIYQRYKPQIIIVDVIKQYDLEKNDNSRYLDFLKMDYGKNEKVDSLFYTIDEGSRYKMLLNCYKYNSTLCDLLINNVLKNRSRFQKDGYFPLLGNKMEKFPSFSKNSDKKIDLDSTKLYYLERIAFEKHNGCFMVFVISPTYLKASPQDYASVSQICQKHHIPMLDYQNDKRFLGKAEMFYDGSHLNDKGSELYTTIVASDIKKILLNQNRK